MAKQTVGIGSSANDGSGDTLRVGADKINDNFKKASSNIPRVSTLNCSGINVKDLITNHKIFIDEKSIDQITKRLS